MKSFSKRGIVLGVLPFRENDQIIKILLEDFGKISALASFAKKSKKRFPGGLEILDAGTFELQKPRTLNGLFRLTSISQRPSLALIQQNLYSLCIASLFLETTDKLSKEGDISTSEFYHILAEALCELNKLIEQQKILALAVTFFSNLLKKAGYQKNTAFDFQDNVKKSKQALETEFTEIINFLEHILEQKLNSYKNLKTINS